MPYSTTAVCDEFVIANCPQEAAHVQKRIFEELTAGGFDDRQVFAVRLSVEEALVNAMKHGNAGDPSKEIRVVFELDEEKFSIEVEDQGDGFCPDDVPDPTLPENIDRPCGRGLLLMRQFMTSVEHSERGNRVRMTLRR